MADELSFQKSISPIQELEILKLREEIHGARELKAAEIQKTLAEAEKVRAEASGTQQTFQNLWKRPSSWAAILPGLAAILTAGYGAYNGYFAAYFDTQKESLNAKVEVIKADTIKLEAKKELLEGQLQLKQERLKDETERLELKRKEFETQRKDYDRQLVDLKTETQRLNQERKQLAVQLPLENLLGNEIKAESAFNENYTSILNALKNDKDKDSASTNTALVAAQAEKAKSPTVKALLYRTLHLANNDKESLENLKKILNAHWRDMERIGQVFYLEVEWPKEVRNQLFAMLVLIFEKAVNEKSKFTFRLAEALQSLCGWKCNAINDDSIKLRVMTLARDAIVSAKVVEFHERQYALSIIYQINELVGRLLFAQAWQLDKSSQITDANAKRFFDETKSANNSAANQPKSFDKSAWLSWLAQNKSKLDVVLRESANQWPTSLVEDEKAEK